MSVLVGKVLWDTVSGFLLEDDMSSKVFKREGVQGLVVLWGVRHGSVQAMTTTKTVTTQNEATQLGKQCRELVKENTFVIDQFNRIFPVTVMNARAVFANTLDGYLVRCMWTLLVEDNDVDPDETSPLAP